MGPTGGPRLDIPHLAVTCNSVYVYVLVDADRVAADVTAESLAAVAAKRSTL